jgi:hypothetical protein
MKKRTARKAETDEIVRGSGNVFADLGLPDAEERPFAALLYGLSNPTVGRAVLTFTAIVCFVGGIALHFGGRVLLRRLRE